METTGEEKTVLTIPEIAHILRIGRVAAYELAHSRGFPAIRIGRTIRVPREAFFIWLEEKTGSQRI